MQDLFVFAASKFAFSLGLHYLCRYEREKLVSPLPLLYGADCADMGALPDSGISRDSARQCQHDRQVDAYRDVRGVVPRHLGRVSLAEQKEKAELEPAVPVRLYGSRTDGRGDRAGAGLLHVRLPQRRVARLGCRHDWRCRGRDYRYASGSVSRQSEKGYLSMCLL